jgi:hypothetical protein
VVEGSKRGRPSIETMAAQWEFMRANFISAGEDLDWLMISKRDGARLYAAQKNEKAEDMYFKSLYETSVLEKQVAALKDSGPEGVTAVLKSIAAAADALTANPHDVEGNARVVAGRAQLRVLLPLQTAVSDNKAVSGQLVEELHNLLLENGEIEGTGTCSGREQLRDARRFAKKCQSHLLPLVAPELKSAQVKLDMARKQIDEALGQMELWGKREKETADYPSFVSREEDAWLDRERVANQHALAEMRRFVPSKVAEMTVSFLTAYDYIL